MRILFAASEVYPFAKTGGLADVVGSLPKALRARGHDVSIAMPHYGVLKVPSGYAPPENLGVLSVPLGPSRIESATVHRTYLDPAKAIPVYLIGHEQFFRSRKELYGSPDDPLRFTFFSRAVMELVRVLNLEPDVIHCHDWHTGLIPAYARHLPIESIRRRPATIFTIHNLMFQGTSSRDIFALSGLPWSLFNPQGMEFFGQVNFMKSGIVFSEQINTVSPTYAREIQTAERGQSLDGVLRDFAWKLSGIVNGIDFEVWDPASDPLIPQHFCLRDFSGKQKMKRALQEEAGLPLEPRKPLVAFVGRLFDQKGMDLIMPNAEDILETGQLVVLGTGDPYYHTQLEAMANGSSLALFLRYDEALAHRIYAACDIFLMPSAFEPCGLGQLIALRYGSPPLVRRTGGLADTVRDLEQDPAGGTGFVFDACRPEAFRETFHRARRAYADPERWERLCLRAMTQDYSWSVSTLQYERLYQRAVEAL